MFGGDANVEKFTWPLLFLVSQVPAWGEGVRFTRPSRGGSWPHCQHGSGSVIQRLGKRMFGQWLRMDVAGTSNYQL